MTVPGAQWAPPWNVEEDVLERRQKDLVCGPYFAMNLKLWDSGKPPIPSGPQFSRKELKKLNS